MAQAVQFSLNKPQQVIWNSPARFKVIVAGRRMGKTTFAAMQMVAAALATHNHYGEPIRGNSQVLYFGTDREQAKRNVWAMLKEFAKPWTVHVHENTSVLTVNNGLYNVQIRLMGMDDPDKARGMAIRHVVMDEYADMPPQAWPEIIFPALMDSRGTATFIGTPKGRNHFYDLYADALKGELGPEWEAFSFTSGDNDTIHRSELEQMARSYAKGSPELYEQEIEGKFISKGGQLFNRDDFPILTATPNTSGTRFITVDLAGFTKSAGKKGQIARLDETAIVTNFAYMKNVDGNQEVAWHIEDIQHGQWDVEETAANIVLAYAKAKARICGIEKGALMRAVEPYMAQVQRSLGVFMNVRPLTHGNQQKWDRIQWALQGRAKRGLVTLQKGEWNELFLDQAVEFPSKLMHDDLIDGVAYQDQIADMIAFDNVLAHNDMNRWEPTDTVSGY
jgi:hypothetical protein